MAGALALSSAGLFCGCSYDENYDTSDNGKAEENNSQPTRKSIAESEPVDHGGTDNTEA